VRLDGARINRLDCTEASFTNPNGFALSADLLKVDSTMSLRKTQCSSEVRLFGAQTGYLTCDEASFTNPNGPALTADSLTVNAAMSLWEAQCSGEVRLVGAHINQLDCTEASFTGHLSEASFTYGPAINLERASVGQEVKMVPAKVQGSLNLSGTRVGAWSDAKQAWPEQIQLEGFVYEAIETERVSPRERLDWLRRHKDSDGRSCYVPQPYEQLTAVYRRTGNPEGARTVAIAKQQDRRTSVEGWARWPTRAWSVFLRWTIGYGYRPARALIPLAVLLIAGWLIFDAAYPMQLRPAKTGLGQPGFHAARYALDLLLPVANFKQRDAFVAYGWAAWASFFFIFAGWLLAIVIVAGLSGVFKRD
jgi:hypothetical protein